MVDHSQGHAAYLEDALVVLCMNVRPGRKQAHIHDSWYLQNGRKVVQSMKFPADHTEYPHQPKGIKVILTKHGLYQVNLQGKCPSKCNLDKADCCNKQILEHQPNFQQQKSLVQEVIEAVGHLCIFLPKFHCKLNFIEFFWGVVKRYLQENCDYIFDTLKENMLKAMESVKLEVIHCWEHRMFRWMEAYRSGLGTADTQACVKEFSSTKYKSHRCIPEAVARTLD